MAAKKKGKKKRSKAKKAGKQAAARIQKGALNLGALENEIKRLSNLLMSIKKKSALVRRSLAYLDREQKRVMRQISQARRFLTRLKNRGLKAWQGFPGNAETLYRQLKAEFNRISQKLLSSKNIRS